MDVLMAALPIATVLVLMVAFGWPAARAGMVGLLVTALLAVTAFGLGVEVLAELGRGAAVAATMLEAGFTTLTILWIILPALAIYHLQLRTGGTEVMRHALSRLTDDPRVAALLIAWFFALFMEGAAGFGASVALAAPFLVSAGFGRVQAVTAALVGHAVGVSFGAVGTPVVPQAAATGLTLLELSRATGIYHATLGWVPLVILMAAVHRATYPGVPLRQAPWGLTAVAGGAFLLPYLLLSRYVGPELPTLAGALFGGLAFVVVLRARTRRPEGQPEVVAPPGSLLRAATPYLVLVSTVLLTRLLPPLQDALRQVTWSWELAGELSGSVQPLYHPGTMLALGFLAGALAQRARPTDVRTVLAYTTGQLGAVTVALLGMLGLSRLMVYSGMTDVLAESAAVVAGGGWPLVAPLVGVLGTFVTGSATASNILFTDFQVATAEGLGLPIAPLAGAQGFGAAVGNIVCPHNIVAAGATVALEGQEGAILRRTIWVALLYAALGGLLALAFAGMIARS